MTAWQDRLINEFRRDWRRTSVLVVLAITGIVVAVRQFGGEPNRAAGGPQTRDSAFGGAARPSDGNLGVQTAGRADLRAGKSGGGSTWSEPAADRGQAQEFAELRVGPPARVQPPRRDPFAVALESFPEDPAAAKLKKPSAAQVAGSDEAPDAAALAERAARQAIEADARNLHLQTVLMGETPRVMINGEIYTLNQRIGKFHVSRITPAGVTLEREGLEVVLKMK